MKQVRVLGLNSKRSLLSLILFLNLFLFTSQIEAFPIIPIPPIIPITFRLWNYTADGRIMYSPALVEITG
ncbi:MAG: hypothetical protein ACFFB5_05340 [Promethearchaeota archaeon]